MFLLSNKLEKNSIFTYVVFAKYPNKDCYHVSPVTITSFNDKIPCNCHIKNTNPPPQIDPQLISNCIKNSIYPKQSTQYVHNLSQALKIWLKCPISGDFFKSATLIPCGHIIDSDLPNQSLEQKKECPIDGTPIQNNSLIPCHLIQQIADKRLITVFLKPSNQLNYLPDRSAKPVLDMANLPCGHSFSEFFLNQHLRLDPSCPSCSLEYNANDIVPNTEAREQAKQDYSEYLEKIHTWNEELDKKVIDLQLDDRSELLSTIQNTKTCPSSKNIIENPMTAKCGHTFDELSIKPGAVCPIDCSPLDVRQNFFIKNILKEIGNDFHKKTLTIDEKGVFLLLNPNTATLDKIEKIAIALGLMQPAKQSYDKRSYSYFGGDFYEERSCDGKNYFGEERSRLLMNHNNFFFINKFTPYPFSGGSDYRSSDAGLKGGSVGLFEIRQNLSPLLL